MLRKTNTNAHNNDTQLLLAAMQQMIEGNYSAIDETAFTDAALAQKFNEMILSLKKSNNNYAMRLNESMEHIGDNSAVKEMVEEVTAQTASIQAMTLSSKALEASIQEISEEVGHIREDAQSAIAVSKTSVTNMGETISAVTDSVNEIRGIHQKVAEFNTKIEQISEIIDMVKKLAKQSNLLALNASIEAARAGEAGRGFAIVANQVKDLSTNTGQSAETVVSYVTELQESLTELKALVDSTTAHLEAGNAKVAQSVEDINSMSGHMDHINNRLENIFQAVNTQNDVTNRFVQSIESMAASYEVLERDCMATGDHLHSISRYVDSARGDLSRGFCALTTQDWVRNFQIDHHILTWRIYNNIAGFEHLKLEQVNNNTGCKLGKWIAAQTDARITGSRELSELKRCHDDLHKHATDSWHAQEAGNREEALRHFDLTLAAYKKFYQAIENFKAFLRTIGHVEETPIKAFKK